MNLSFLRRAGLFSAIGATLIGLASCININEELGQNLIPTHHQWDVFPSAEAPLTDIVLKASDSLSAYSTRRITFGAINDEILGSCTKASSFTLVPVIKDLDLGENTVVKQFHFSAVRDTLSTVYEQQERMMQNIYVYGLKEALDSTILYTNSLTSGVLSQDKTTTNREKFLNLDRLIAKGIPVYNGSDSLSFDFTDEFAAELVTGVKAYRKACLEQQDTLLSDYLKHVPGIYIEAETPQGYGGRINMFDIALEFDTNGYISGNYAELKITADYGDRKQVDTSFIFIYGPSDFIPAGSTSVPSQYAFNGSTHASDALYTEGIPASDKIYVEGGCGVKPVITAAGIKAIVHEQIQKAGIVNPNEVVINKATIKLPYDVNGDWSKLDRYPTILSPTVRLRGKVESGGTYVSYAGLTDASIESENQGDINRSLSLYSPDISHHVQEILKLQPEDGESDADFAARLAKYDIWMLIMHEEVTVTTSPGGSNNDYYNSLLYNSYYNNMMYDPYGYGYGYGGYGGYGYGGYGYGYGGYGSNYYNYMMMASYMNSGSNSSESVSIDLDKDRYYNCTLAGPSAAGVKPTLSITFSAPKTAEKTE